MKRKLISLFAALMMIVQTVVPVFAIELNAGEQMTATEPTAVKDTADEKDVQSRGTYGNLKYEIADGEVTITGYTTEPEGDLVIPEMIEGYPVTGIGDYAFIKCQSLSSVELPNVKSIGDSAFISCDALKNVELPNVLSIGRQAFDYCYSLANVEMPNIKEVAGNSFENTAWYDNLTEDFCIFGEGVLVKYCGSDTDVTVPNNVKCVAGFHLNNYVKTVSMPNVQTIADYAFAVGFYYPSSLVCVKMPSVQTIGDYAFYECQSLTSVEMPNVQTIGDYAFYQCGSLISAEMQNVLTIGENTFYDCYSLNSLEMQKVIEIKYSAFWNCYSLTSAEMQSVQTIGNYTFENCRSLTSVKMSNVQIIGDGAFESCSSLTRVELPNVQTIGDSAFCVCDSLTSAKMPNVRKIGDNAFGGCDSLISAEMSNVQTIGCDAFGGCDSLISAEMPNVQAIGRDAFSGCYSLTSAEMPNVQTISGGAFAGCSCLTSFIISESNPDYSADGSILYNKNKTSLIAYPAASGNIVITNSVQTICDSAFEYCNSLTSVEMPNVQTIGDKAFEDCNSLTSVEMPNVQTISYCAFENCDSLTSVEMSNVQTIGDEAFYGCDSLTSAYFYSDAPDEFGEYVFDDCADDFTIYYAKCTSGWTAPTWNGYTTQEFEPNIEPTPTPTSTPTPTPTPEQPHACSLNKLTSVDYLAFASLAYEDAPDYCCTIEDYLISLNKWNKNWKGTNVKYNELYDHIKDWIIATYQNGLEGFYAVAFINDNNEMIISYRGSEKDTFEQFLDDWILNDLYMTFSAGNGSQVKQAIGFYNDMKKLEKPPKKICVAGHSLGGALGDIVAAYAGLGGETFNAACFMNIAYYYYPELMSRAFHGTDKWGFIDHINDHDVVIGAQPGFMNQKPRIMHEDKGLGSESGYGVLRPHSLNSFLIRDSDGKLDLIHGTKHNVNAAAFLIYNVFDNAFEVLSNSAFLAAGTSHNDEIHNSFPTTYMYGGDGQDRLNTGVFNDVLIGGKGYDMVNGSWGNDTYIYHKGDGNLIIRDEGGIDRLLLEDFDSSDSITTKSNDDFMIVSCNGTEIVKIYKVKRSPISIFKIINNLGKADGEIDISDEFDTASYSAHYEITSDANIEVMDSNGNVVYTICDAVSGEYKFDYGYYSVFEAEDNKNCITIDLFDGYDIRILATEGGTIDVVACPVVDDVIDERYSKDDITVTSDTSITIEQASNGDIILVVDNDSDGIVDNETTLEMTPIDEVGKYTVTFRDGVTGEIISKAQVEHGADAVMPEAPGHDGYTFTGWDSDGKNITADTTITAQYAINTYTVTFMDGHTNEIITTVAVEHGNDVVFPEAPVHEGYVFMGWDDLGHCIMENRTITALYEKAAQPTPTATPTSTPTTEPTPTTQPTPTATPTQEPTITPTTEPTPTQEPQALTGDLNGDGTVNTADAVVVLKSAAGMVHLDEKQNTAGDCNHDGAVNTADAVLILKYAAGIITEL